MDSARRKASVKRGGDLDRIEVPEIAQASENKQVDLIALDELLTTLEQLHPENAQILKLRFFAGLSLEEAAQVVGISRATAQRKWAYARAWLFGRLQGTEPHHPSSENA